MIQVEDREAIRRAYFVDQGPDSRDACIVIRLAEIHGAADLRVHFCSAQIFRRSLLPNGGLYQRWSGQK